MPVELVIDYIVTIVGEDAGCARCGFVDAPPKGVVFEGNYASQSVLPFVPPGVRKKNACPFDQSIAKRMMSVLDCTSGSSAT